MPSRAQPAVELVVWSTEVLQVVTLVWSTLTGEAVGSDRRGLAMLPVSQ